VIRLLLAIEASSPTTARADRLKERPIYQGHGVPEYWIVDDDSRLVERWRPDDQRPEIVHEILAWQPVPEIPALRIDLNDVLGRDE